MVKIETVPLVGVLALCVFLAFLAATDPGHFDPLPLMVLWLILLPTAAMAVYMLRNLPDLNR